MKTKETKKKILKIVLPDVERKTYDRIKQLADEERRTIGKQAEYLAALAIDKLYKK